MLSTILIIDKRKELSIKYKRSIDETSTNTIIASTLKDAIKLVQTLEPEIIIVSDSIDEELAEFCKKVRALTYNTRPVIIALSKSADISDRISVLENGADDFISEPVNIEEFKTRIKAHLRRDIESNLDNKTLLPNKKYVDKALQRVLSSSNSAVLLIEIKNLEIYQSIYTELAADKIIQTFVAIAKSAIGETDFIGQLNETEFIIVTNKYSLEKIANFLAFAFDTVIPKFYSDSDNKRGYSILKSESSAGIRANFVSILIGAIQDGFNLIPNRKLLLNKLKEIVKLAKIPNGSNYLIERTQISTHDSVSPICENKNIYVKEKDESLEYLIRTSLELQGYSVQDSIENDITAPPAIIIMDSGDKLEELANLRKLKNTPAFYNTTFIVTTTVHDKTTILDSGADLYLPKPYEISDLVRWIEYFIKSK